MAREISTGTHQILKHLSDSQTEQSQMQWRDLRNKLDSLLLSTNILKSDEARQQCLLLDGMTPPERETHIIKFWGVNYLSRVSPLLHQLKILEGWSDSKETHDAPSPPPIEDALEENDS